MAKGRTGKPRPRRSARARRKTYGQNFIRSAQVAGQFVAAAKVQPGDLVIEVGAGAGMITKELAQRTSRLVALEIDPDWAAKLRQRFEPDRVRVMQLDVTSYRWPAEPFRVVGNIPFGISTKLMHGLLDRLALPLVQANLIVQHEVARKRALPGPSTVLGLSWQPWFSFKLVRRIPATAFEPMPAVDAAHLEIRRRPKPLLDPSEQAAYVGFVRAGFERGGLLRAGLRTQLTNNQVRILRSAIPFDEGTLSSSLDVGDWIGLFERAQSFRT